MNHKLDYVLWGGVIVKVGPEPSACGAKNCLHLLDLRGLGGGGGFLLQSLALQEWTREPCIQRTGLSL